LALETAKEFLAQRGNSPRIYQNTLVFLAPDRSRLDELEQAARYYLAWQSILEQETELNLDKSQSRQAGTQKATWDRTTTSRIGETYQWLLVPTQPNPQAPLEWQQTRLTGADMLAARASKKLRNDGQMVAQFTATFLRQALDTIPFWRGNHVAVKLLVEDFARYPYLQRLRDGDVLLGAMREGVSSVTWRTDTFAFADSYDEAKGRYFGLRGGQVLGFGSDGIGLLVKSGVADSQMDAERPKPPTQPGATGGEPSGVCGEPSKKSQRNKKRQIYEQLVPHSRCTHLPAGSGAAHRHPGFGHRPFMDVRMEPGDSRHSCASHLWLRSGKPCPPNCHRSRQQLQVSWFSWFSSPDHRSCRTSVVLDVTPT
jgi:hypothetical protein